MSSRVENGYRYKENNDEPPFPTDISLGAYLRWLLQVLRGPSYPQRPTAPQLHTTLNLTKLKDRRPKRAPTPLHAPPHVPRVRARDGRVHAHAMLVRRDLLVPAAGRNDAERLPRRVHPGGARVVPDVDLAEVALAAGVAEIVDDGGVGGGGEGEEEEGGGVHGWGVVVGRVEMGWSGWGVVGGGLRCSDVMQRPICR